MEPQFIRIGEITAHAATPAKRTIEQIERNIKRGFPKFQTLPGVQSNDRGSIAIVGGGPSLRDTFRELRKFNIISAGSANDFLGEMHITPKYSVVCDPDAIASLYLENTNDETIYLVATSCHDSVFDKLKNRIIYTWHCYSDEHAETIHKEDPNPVMIGGGCTVGSRAISIAIILGYRDLHLFGFDSCLSDNQSVYAYDRSNGDIEDQGKIYRVCIGLDGPGKKVYHCLGYQMAQAMHFLYFYKDHRNKVKFTIHGNGLLADMLAFEEAREAIRKKGFF